MSDSSNTIDSLEHLARLSVCREPHPGHAQFWCDGQRRKAPYQWLIEGTRSGVMHLNNAARLLLTQHENTRMVSSRLGGQVDAVEIKFVDYSTEEHEVRKSNGRKYYASTDPVYVAGTKSKEVNTSCNVDVFYRHHCTDALIELEGGQFVPARILLVRMCTFKDCEERHTKQLHDLDVCEIYPSHQMGLPVCVYASCKGDYLRDCLGAILRYIAFQFLMIQSCRLVGFGTHQEILEKLKASDPFNFNRSQFSRLYDTEILNVVPEVQTTLAGRADHLCYKCFSEKFGSNAHAPGVNHYFEETGVHGPEEFEGALYAAPYYICDQGVTISTSHPVKQPWYMRRQHFDVHV